MSRPTGLVAGLLLFLVIVGTANAGGYRFGVSDQAFYIPAISLRADASLFPRDRAVFEPQMRFWAGDELLGAAVRSTGVALPHFFGTLYLLTMAVLGLAGVFLARALGFHWWSIAAFIILLTLRHRIARTGANSLEGYMHPRMLAFSCGLVALGCLVRLRHVSAVLWTLVAAVVHTSTAIWFGLVVLVAAWWPHRATRAGRLVAAAAIAAGVVFAAVAIASMPRMDAAWLTVLGDRDYLFSADWPLYAWLSNLAYPVVLLAIFRKRVRMGVAVPGEGPLVAGLVAIVLAFLATIPLAELRIAFFVQLQANRVFWLLDAVVAGYIAWWLVECLPAFRVPARRTVLVAALAALAVGRGIFVLQEAERPLVQFDLPDDDWRTAMRWLQTQPASWHVLADPGHAYRYGSSVRVAALRDTPLELGKDPAMAMYDQALARRVAERTAAFAGFDDWQSDEDVRAAASRFELDVFVDRADRTFGFPVLYRNPTFVVYDLR